jgi:hypothetical protein
VWLGQLDDAGVVELDWRIFSLELNSSEMGAPFLDSCTRHGESLVVLTLALRDGATAPSIDSTESSAEGCTTRSRRRRRR